MKKRESKKLIFKKYIQPYEKILKKAKVKLDLKTPVEIKISHWWYFHYPLKRDKVTLYCPPYLKEFEPAFLHYLCHAKILEEGWPRVKVQIQLAKTFNKIEREKIEKLSKKEQRLRLLLWDGRAGDSFFDFYTFRLLAEKVGLNYFKRFVRMTTNLGTKKLLKGLEEEYKLDNFIFSVYTYCLDWFAMLYVNSQNLDKESYKKLGKMFRELLKEKTFQEMTFPNIKQRIQRVRNFYKKLSQKYSNYKELLKDGKAVQNQLVKYSQLVWRSTGLKVKIVGFE